VLAAALVAVWLRRGERRTWAAARSAVRQLAAWWGRIRTLLVQHDEPPAPSSPAPVHVPVPRRPLLRHVVVRRGPPLHV
jgi:hypothetical protein